MLSHRIRLAVVDKQGCKFLGDRESRRVALPRRSARPEICDHLGRFGFRQLVTSTFPTLLNITACSTSFEYPHVLKPSRMICFCLGVIGPTGRVPAMRVGCAYLRPTLHVLPINDP